MAYEIKREPEDFIVEEITPEKKILEIDESHKFKEGDGEQLVCVLQKRNWDNNLALREIAKRLFVSRSRIGFAGTKDKRAITTQRISLWKIKNADRLFIKDIKLVPLKYSDKRIELGDLWGNRFTIKVYTKKKIRKLKTVPNFFGVQRFGEVRPLTHLVGKEIVWGDFEGAVKMYLAKVFPAELKEAKDARRKLAKDWDYAKALAYFPMGLRFERTMIGHLAESENDYIGALRKLPKFLKIMFVHAYQAYLFNEFLKEVVKKKGKHKTGQLFGYESKVENELERRILKKEKVEPKDFFIRSMPEMSSRGEKRELFIELKDFKVIEKGRGYYVVRFSLPKGCYATTVIDQLFS